MALRPLAEPQDLGPYLGSATVPEEKVLAALAAASALVRSYTRSTEGWATGDIPDPVFQATLFIARRVALMPDGATGDESVGPFAVKRDSSMWLSSTEKLLLAPYRGSTLSTLEVQGPTGRWPISDFPVPCQGTSEPILFAEGDG